jgi:hypothetical protein
MNSKRILVIEQEKTNEYIVRHIQYENKQERHLKIKEPNQILWFVKVAFFVL